MFGADRGGLDSEVFPDHIETSGSRWRLEYRHEPGELGDGVAINVALAALADLSADRLEWGVPGMLSERVEAMIRSLPKRLRTRFSPVRETTSALVETMTFGEGALSDVLARHLTAIGGVVVESSDFDRARLPEHLRMLMIVRDDEGQEVARGRSLETLRATLAPRVQKAFHDRSRWRAGGPDRSERHRTSRSAASGVHRGRRCCRGRASVACLPKKRWSSRSHLTCSQRSRRGHASCVSSRGTQETRWAGPFRTSRLAARRTACVA